jgi:aryl-alcohol dehydrogenase-like predicted oxidoreductase
MKTRTLGNSGLIVSELGLGCMGMTSAYGAPGNHSEMLTLIRNAVDCGVTFFDTAEVYGPFINEELVGEALAGVRNKVVIATKFGYDLESMDSGAWPTQLNSRPGNIKAVADAALKRLRTDRIDLFFQHRVDPAVPIEDVAGAVADLVKAGKVLHFGLSEANGKTIRRAHAVLPVTAVQTEYSMWTRDSETDVIPTVEALGIGFVAYSPLGRGFLTGAVQDHTSFQANDYRAYLPRFSQAARGENLALVESLKEFGTRKNATVAQIALAWLLARKPWIVPIPGTRQRSRLNENLAATEVTFTADDLTQLDKILTSLPIVGSRYGEADLAMVD